MTIAKKALLGFFALAAASEATVRFSGLIDFPVYEANNVIGYIPSPNQSGSFLNRNQWEFNEFSMGSGPFEPGAHIDTLLVGDSIVLGGNPYKKDEKLGPRLQSLIGGRVWPISAGSWGISNELTYLQTHPEVVAQIDAFVFVTNSADFDGPSQWTCDLSHPVKRPFFAVAYILRKNVFDFIGCGETPANLKVAQSDWRIELRKLFDQSQKPITFVMYPHKAEITGQKSLSDFHSRAAEIQSIAKISGREVKFIFVANDKEWGISLYKDNIHPTPDGMAILARIVSDGLKK